MVGAFRSLLSAKLVDITTLTVDAIVNAANSELAPGGGVCGAIHAAAGPELARACARLGACATGDARLTPGLNLPARSAIHPVGRISRPRAHIRTGQVVSDLYPAPPLRQRDGLLRSHPSRAERASSGRMGDGSGCVGEGTRLFAGATRHRPAGLRIGPQRNHLLCWGAPRAEWPFGVRA